jgi:selenide,water dikinase
VLRPIQNLFDRADYPDLLVGLQEPDDAAVWRLEDDRALVITTDFFTPVVDDPYDYGAIAAANALSDVYAMGGQPFLALNIAAFPPALPGPIIREILRGGAEKAHDAGVVIAGGHSIQDQEPKYGLIVIGFVNPERMLTKSKATPGDALVLSKPLGFGTTTTALKGGYADPADITEVTDWMKRLNKTTAELAGEFGVQAGTDVTGFGLLGHAWEMAEASQVGLCFNLQDVPFTAGAFNYAQRWIFPGGSSDNRLFYQAHVRFAPGIDEPTQMLLFDAQTSGGLLLAVPPQILEVLLSKAEKVGQELWVVGQVVDGNDIKILE